MKTHYQAKEKLIKLYDDCQSYTEDTFSEDEIEAEIISIYFMVSCKLIELFIRYYWQTILFLIAFFIAVKLVASYMLLLIH